LRTPYAERVKDGTRERLQGRATLDMLYVTATSKTFRAHAIGVACSGDVALTMRRDQKSTQRPRVDASLRFYFLTRAVEIPKVANLQVRAENHLTS
jgi:hypothetical protein